MSDQFPRFGATDFYTCETDAAALAEQLRAALASYLGYTPTDSDPYMVVAFALLPYIVQNNALADIAAKTALLTYAIGGQLDRIADATCVVEYLTRREPTPAFFAVKLGFSDCEEFPEWEQGKPTEIQVTFTGSFTINGVTYTARDPYGVSWIPMTTILGNLNIYRPWGIAYFFAEMPGSIGNISNDDAQAFASAVSAGVGAVTVDGISFSESDGMTITPLGACSGKDTETDEDLADRLARVFRAIRIPGGLEYYQNAVNGLYGLGSYYIAPNAYWTNSLAQENGAVQTVYMEDRPVGCSDELDPTDPGGVIPLSTRFALALSTARLMCDKILYKHADTATGYPFNNAVELHFSLSSLLDDVTRAEVLAAISAEYEEILDDYTNRPGILINFDDMVARIVTCGALEASAMVAIADVPAVNTVLAPDSYLPPTKLSIEQDADITPPTIAAGSPGSLIVGG